MNALGRIYKVIVLRLVFCGARQRQSKGLGASGPIIYHAGQESLLDAAINLASGSQSDQEIAADLRHLANAREEDLSTAVALLERQYFPFDLADANRAWRCLRAAVTDSPVEQLTPSDVKRFAELGDLAQLTNEEAFRSLAALEPRLLEMERTAISDGTALRQHNQPGTFDTFLDLEQVLESMLGPQSAAENPILCSRIAFQKAAWHLEDIAGLLDT